MTPTRSTWRGNEEEEEEEEEEGGEGGEVSACILKGDRNIDAF